MDLQTALVNFKKFYGIPENTNINLDFKFEDNDLFVKYKENWIQLNYKKSPEKFKMKSSLGIKFSNKFMAELIPTPLIDYPTGEYPELKNDPSCQWVSAKAKKCNNGRRPNHLYCWNHNTQIQNGAEIPKPLVKEELIITEEITKTETVVFIVNDN